jgi:hypothetical protein
MTFKQAIQKMAEYEKSDEAIRVIFDAVESLCKTPTNGEDNTTPLWDWLSETGGYSGKETPASIAKEWDSLSEN